MNKRLRNFIILTVIIITFFGCKKGKVSTFSSEANESFIKILLSDNINSSLNIKISIEDQKVYEFSDDIKFWIENTTNNQYRLDQENPVSLFVYRDGEWLEILNNVEYIYTENGSIIDGIDSTGIPRIRMMVSPALPNELEEKPNVEYIRVLIRALPNQVIREPENFVYAYVDIEVKPSD